MVCECTGVPCTQIRTVAAYPQERRVLQLTGERALWLTVITRCAPVSSPSLLFPFVTPAKERADSDRCTGPRCSPRIVSVFLEHHQLSEEYQLLLRLSFLFFVAYLGINVFFQSSDRRFSQFPRGLIKRSGRMRAHDFLTSPESQLRSEETEELTQSADFRESFSSADHRQRENEGDDDPDLAGQPLAGALGQMFRSQSDVSFNKFGVRFTDHLLTVGTACSRLHRHGDYRCSWTRPARYKNCTAG